jgi:hypothetical protein
MPSLGRIWIVGLALLSLAAWGSKKVQVLESLTPSVSKQEAPGYTAQGTEWRYRDDKIDFRVAPLTAEDRGAFYREKGLVDPFASFRATDNLLLFRVRIENLSKDTPVEFSPTATMFGNSVAFDETYIFQYLYKESNADEKLTAVGKTLFLSHLQLPPGTWIERLMAFTYDDPYTTKTLRLVVQGLMAGPEGLNLEFPFKASYRKEKLP